MISRSLTTSERNARLYQTAGALAEFCQTLYPYLVVCSDDFGRQQGSAFTVKHAVFPISPRPVEDFNRALQHLHDVGLIVLYVVDGEPFIQITKFEQHQSGLHKRTQSKFPPIPGSSSEVPETSENAGNSLEIPGQEKRRELNGREEERSRAQTGGVLAGALPRDHGNHAWCNPTFSYCVPSAVHVKLKNLLAPKYAGNREQAATALLAWYPSVVVKLAPDAVMGDAFKFWQPKFDAKFVQVSARANEPRLVVDNAEESRRRREAIFGTNEKSAVGE